MKGSLRIATVAGTGVFLHWTFFVLIVWLFVSQAIGSGLMAAVETLLVVGAVFLCVTLHEIGHAAMAARFGIRTQDITLLPIGGVARLRKMPEEPRKELAIALAGPAVNVVIAAGLYAGMWMSGLNVLPVEQAVLQASFLTSMFWFNVIVVAFNMIPAFPMDGGRVFRALLAIRRGYVDATRTAARIGQAIAVVFIVLGLMYNWLLAFVGAFVYFSAMAESRAVEVRLLAMGATASDAMQTRVRMLDWSDRLEYAAEETLAGAQSEFPVLLENGTTGVLTRSMLLRELKSRGPLVSLGEVIRSAAPEVPAGMPLEKAMEILARTRSALLVVNSLSEPVGLLTVASVDEWILIETALRSHMADLSKLQRPRPVGEPQQKLRFPQFGGRDRFTFPSV